MAKKPTKSLTDDWIKQVVTGQRHKLAHMADGGEVTPDEPTPIGFAKYLMRGAQMVPQPVLAMPEIRQRVFPVSGVAPVEPAQETVPAAASEPVAAPVLAPTPAEPTAAITRYTTENADRTGAALRAAGAYANGGCVKKMVAGGEVDGPGTETSDSIPAMLSDGEYVLPADTVDAVGKATLDKLKAATHTPTKKPSMKGMIVMRADGGGAEPSSWEKQVAAIQEANRSHPSDSSNIGAVNRFFSGVADIPGNVLSGVRSAVSPVLTAVAHGNIPKMPEQQAAPMPAVTQPAATVDAPIPTPTPAVAAAPTAKQVEAPNFLPALSGPNTAQDLISRGQKLMNTQGIGGFVQAKGLNRAAQTINQTNEPLIAGQFGLQREAMNANERLEQAKLVEHQRKQNQETWTPDKNMMGELVGYGRTKGGRPEYVTKESLMSKPSLAQFLAKAKPVNPKATEAELIAHYNSTYAQND